MSTIITGAWIATNGKHVAVKTTSTQAAALVEQVKRGMATSVTFDHKGEAVTLTLTSVVGYGATRKPNSRYPEGKPYALCTFAEAAEQVAARGVKARRESKGTATAPAPVKTADIGPGSSIDQGHAPTPEQVLALVAAGFSTDEVKTMFGGTRAVATSSVTVAPSAPAPSKRAAKAPSVAQLAQRERFAQQARERAAARKGTTAPTSAPTPAVAPTAVATAPVKAAKACPSCQKPMVVGYRHVAADTVKVCGDCIDLPAADLLANLSNLVAAQ